jgi:hypothetical protein
MDIPETVLSFLVKDEEEVTFAAHCYFSLAHMYIAAMISLGGSPNAVMIVRQRS